MKITILSWGSGGGIGGLTLAVALSKLDLDNAIKIDIYEAASELTQVGAGITFWPRAWDIIEKLGLDGELAEHLAPGQHIPDGKPRQCYLLLTQTVTYPLRLVLHCSSLGLAFQFRKADQRQGVPIRDLIISGMLFSILGNSPGDFLNFFRRK